MFLIIVAIIGISITYFLAEGMFPIVVLIVFLGVAVVIAYTSITSMNGILKNNRKMVIKGIITGERQQRTGAGRNRTYTYFKTIGTKELQVDAGVYRRYKVGNSVEIHYALNGKMVPYVFVDKLLSEL